MKSVSLHRAISLILGCCAMLSTSALLAQDDEDSEDKAAGTNEILLGIQALDDEGDSENLERNSDGLDDSVVLELLRLAGESDRNYYSLEGRDIGQRDQSLELTGGIYGKVKVKASWDEQFRNYTDGVSLGTRVRSDYWGVADPIQASLEPGFVPLNTNPTAAGQANLRSLLGGAPSVPLQQERHTGAMSVEFAMSPGFNLRAGFNHEKRDGLKAVANGGYSRSTTGATAIGGLGENFRTYGLEFPMPTEYSTSRINFGADYNGNSWFGDFGFNYTKFENDVNSITYDNPLMLSTNVTGVGSASMRLMALAPDYDSTAFSFTGGVRDLPMRSRITATYSYDSVTQDQAFVPYAANPGLRDDSGQLVNGLAPPQANLDGDVTTQMFNVVLNSRPVQSLSTNLRFNRYDYANDSDAITWDGWAAVGETSWRDYDGSNTAQLPYRNRVPEFTRTRTGIDGTYSFSSTLRLMGEYLYEQYDRNADRYADNNEDRFHMSLTWLPVDFATLKFGATELRRDIDGYYAEHLQNGVQEEWEELRMFDQAQRDRTRFDFDADIDAGENFSIGLSFSHYEDTYDEEFYGLHDFTGFLGGVDFTWLLTERFTATAYYNLDKFESNQSNRGKSNALGAGAFAVPENDFDSYLEDETDSYGLGFDAVLIEERMSLSINWDVSNSNGKVETTNPNYLLTATTSGAIAYAWPDTKVDTEELVVALNYNWSENLTTSLRYAYLTQDITDFAADLTSTYIGPVRDTQGNNPSHQIYMGAHPYDYTANVLMATLNYRF